MNLSNESLTMFITLYGKSYVSKKYQFFKDVKAEEIVNSVNYDFSKLKQSKWLSLFLATRSLIMDNLVNEYLDNHLDSLVIHLGCGLDSRVSRVNQKYSLWYDIDFENVISFKKNYFTENNKYKMIGKSVNDLTWIDDIPFSKNTLVVAEGLFMYLSQEEIIKILNIINKRFNNATLIFDSYSKKAVKLSKYKNPVNQMNACVKFGIDNEDEFLNLNSNLHFENKFNIKYENNNLKGLTKFLFNNLYCGKLSQSL